MPEQMFDVDEAGKMTRVDNNPLAVIANAVEKGMDADQLGKLVDLHERIEKMNSLRAYQESMCACQADMQSIVKEAENKHTKSKYALLEHIVHAIKPIYTKHGFSLSFHQGELTRDGWMRILADVMHTRGHREVKFLDLPIDGTGAKGGNSAMNAVQGVGSTTTYGKRYLTCEIFNLVVAGMDLDGNNNEPTLTQEQIDLIEKMMDEAEADKAKFLAWAAISRVADLPQAKFPTARGFLQDKIDKLRATT